MNQLHNVRRSGRLISLLLALALLLPAAQPRPALAQDGADPTVAAEVTDVSRHVSYAQISSNATGDGERDVTIKWTTAAETINAGFNIVIADGDGFVAVNDELVPSVAVDSLEPQDYAATVRFAGDAFYLEHVTVNGDSHRSGPYAVGETIGEVVEPEAVDWNAIRAESDALARQREAKRIEEINAALDAVRVERAEPGARLIEQTAGTLGEFNTYLPLVAGTGASAAVGSAAVENVAIAETVNLLVEEEGVYRVKYEDLADPVNGPGIDFGGVPAAYLAVTNMGEPVRLRMVAPVNSQGQAVWGPNAYFEFIGEGIETLYTKQNVYVLQVDRSKAFRTYRNLRAPDAGEAAPEYYMESAPYEENLRWAFSAPVSDPWAWFLLNRTGSTAVSKTFDFNGISALEPDLATELFLEVWGYGSGNHTLQVELNGNRLAPDVTYSGDNAHNVTLSIPSSVLQNGANSLKLTVPPSAVVKTDAQMLEGFTLHYPRQFVADSGVLDFVGSAKRYAVYNLPSNDVLVYSVYRNRVWRHEAVPTSVSGGSYSASVYGWGDDAQYYVVDNGAAKTPLIQAGQLLTTDITDGSYDYVIISHPDFIGAIESLKDRRVQEGYRVKIVNVLDIYAQFNHGLFDAHAIQDYITYASNSMDAEYFLLVGDDTYDYFNYTGRNAKPFIPSLYGSVLDWNFAAVDPLFTDTNGDGVPDAKLGRFPARTTQEATIMVNKTLNYAPNGTNTIFTADTGFKGESNSFVSLLPASWQSNAETAYLDDMSDTDAYYKLLAEVNSGVTFVSYLGHGSMQKWTLAGKLLNNAKAQNFANTGKAALFMQWGCNTSMYNYGWGDTISEVMMFSENRGAVATFAATGGTLLSSDEALAERMTPRVITPGKTLGEAIHEARQSMLTEWGYSADVFTGMVLLGDPALVLIPAQ